MGGPQVVSLVDVSASVVFHNNHPQTDAGNWRRFIFGARQRLRSDADIIFNVDKQVGIIFMTWYMIAVIYTRVIELVGHKLWLVTS